MKNIIVEDIIRECNGKLICGDISLKCKNFSKDTRNINKGDIYVGIKGENFDGNTLYEEAFIKGASACILQKIDIKDEEMEKYKDKTIILVEDTIDAIGKIAKYKRSLYDIPVIAVTGSVGKTSTKDIIASVVSQKYKVLKTEGNMNNHIGLPFTILRLEDHEALVVEMGMNHFGEIRYLTNIANPNIAIITNIGTSHIGNLGSRENILKAKLEILEGIKKEGTVIINNDNDLLHKWIKCNAKYAVITYGIDEESDLMPYNINIKENASTYNIKIENKEYTVEVPVSGKHFVYNSMCALGVGIKLNIKIQDILEGIKKFQLTKKRMDVQKIKDNITVINDSYNASYDSMKVAIEYIREIKGKRKIAVLGDMLELGEFSEILHKEVGAEVYKNSIDILITVGNMAKYIAEEAENLGMNTKNIYQFENNNEAIEKINNILQNGDIILLKASNAMNFSQILEEIKK